jgi:Ca-activated chloride channel family protein
MSNLVPNQPEGPRATILGKLVIFAFIAACGYGAYRMLHRGPVTAPPTPGSSSSKSIFGGGGEAPSAEIGIAYGTEKKNWMEWAVAEFAKTDEGKRIKVNLFPMGSLEGAQALVSGDQRIHVWSPASSLYKDIFVQDWQLKYSKPPILKEDSLALTPMVFVMWDERYQAFKAKYGELSFDTVAKALGESGGWQAIAAKPEWGLFKFGHTTPNESNSGLMTLVLMAYAKAGKMKNLTPADVVAPAFQQQLAAVEKGTTLSSSTGTMMREMVLKGPSAYDAVLVYESLGIDYLKSAAGRWGDIHIIYPAQNLWSDNPYYIIDAPWSSADQRKAAELFLNFMMSEPVQKQALTHGFRPGNPNVPVIFPQSPFVQYQQFGLRNDIGNVAEYPRAETINNLLAAWQRSR